MGFKPIQVLFAPTYRCNLKCRHCTQLQSAEALDIREAARFLKGCHKQGISEIGFTGGEPFLAPGFLAALSREADRAGMRFDRITTNAGWFQSPAELDQVLGRVIAAGYRGSFCISVDKYHQVPLSKVALFIKRVLDLTGWPESISLVHVDDLSRVKKLAAMLKGKINKAGRLEVPAGRGFIGLSAKITGINLCPVGSAGKLADPRGGKWFREDYCAGPGQLLYVLPAGEVKPCCGFASDLPEMSIGNIYLDSAATIIKNAAGDPFVKLVYGRGLLRLRDIYQAHNPGSKLKPTSDHCYFCWYMQKMGVRRYL